MEYHYTKHPYVADEVLEEIKTSVMSEQKDKIIEWLLDALEEEHMGSRAWATEYIVENYGLQY